MNMFTPKVHGGTKTQGQRDTQRYVRARCRKYVPQLLRREIKSTSRARGSGAAAATAAVLPSAPQAQHCAAR